MTDRPVHVFVSYSHDDASLVEPVVKLMRLNDALVFRDVDGIRAGTKWRTAIDRALADAQLVVVFWCGHSSRSKEVSSEWSAAIATQKDVLPLLLDETPLPDPLAEYQWIDLRAAVGASHSASPPQSRPPPAQARERAPARRSGVLAAFGATVALAAASVVLFLYGVGGGLPRGSVGQPIPVDTASPGTIGSPVTMVTPWLGFSIAAVLLTAAAIAFWFWHRNRRDRRSKSRAAKPGVPGREPSGRGAAPAGAGGGESEAQLQRRVALEIETEILRRHGGPS